MPTAKEVLETLYEHSGLENLRTASQLTGRDYTRGYGLESARLGSNLKK